MLRNKLLFLTCLLIGSQLILPAFAGKQYTTYFQSWSEKWGSKGSDLTLANLPSYVNTVILSFMKPDNAYTSGSMALSGAGLDFSSDGSVVKDAIGIAKSNGAKVLVAVGGATYTNWDGLNEAGIAAFVKDFGLDGVDIDYEPANAGCTQSGGTVQCAVDKQFQDVVSRIRKAVPSPAFVSLAGWSIGAYGEGSFQSAQPQGANTGLCVNLLKSDAGKCLDQINIMSYDAGSTFDPKQAFQAYRSLFGGKLALGLEIPPEAWGGHVLSISEVDTLCDFVNQNGADGDGMMLWSLNKKPDGAASASNPDATMVSQEVCKKLGLSGCDKPLPTALGMKVGETSDIFEVIAALNAEKDIWVEHTFGAKRDEMLAKVIANLNREKDMWLSHYMRGLALNEMMVSPQNKMDEDLSLLKTLWDDVRNARIEQHLKGEKVYNDLHELLVALNEEEKLWLAFYSRGKARAGVHVEGRSVEGLPDVMVGLSRSVGSLEDVPETFVEKADTGRRYFRSGLGVAQF